MGIQTEADNQSKNDAFIFSFLSQTHWLTHSTIVLVFQTRHTIFCSMDIFLFWIPAVPSVRSAWLWASSWESWESSLSWEWPSFSADSSAVNRRPVSTRWVHVYPRTDIYIYIYTYVHAFTRSSHLRTLSPTSTSPLPLHRPDVRPPRTPLFPWLYTHTGPGLPVTRSIQPVRKLILHAKNPKSGCYVFLTSGRLVDSEPKIFKISNGPRLLMTRDMSCSQMRQLVRSFDWWNQTQNIVHLIIRQSKQYHVVDGSMEEGRGGA